MFAQFFSLALIALLGAMLPGPDFAIVSKNSIFHSRQSGIWTSFGVGAAILVHMTYCVMGLAIVISSSMILFTSIKAIGASYLIYLGVKALFSKEAKKIATKETQLTKTQISNLTSFKQGFLCNLLNPKATLFFLSIFTVIIKPDTPFSWELIFAFELFFVATAWFCSLTLFLSHPSIRQSLERAEKYIAKLLGVFLIGFGFALAFVKR